MKKKALFLLAALATASCFAQKNIKQVTLTGSIINANDSMPKIMKVNFLNPFEEVSPSVKLGKAPFKIKADMLFTQNMTIQYNNTFINLYVAPGDSVNILINAAKLDKLDFEWLTISGDHAKISNQLNLCYSYMSRLPYKKYDLTLSVPNMLTAVNADYERQIAALTSYAQNHELDPIVIAFEKRDVIYGISNWVNDYVKLGSPETSSKTDRINMFNDPLFDMYNPANFQSMMFPYHLSAYAEWIINEDINFQQSVKTHDQKKMVPAGAARLLKEPATTSRNYMMYSFLARVVKDKPELLTEMPEIPHYFTEQVYYNYLIKTVTLADAIVFPIMPITGIKYRSPAGKITTLQETDIFNYLAGKFPGKVIYIDVFATWCGPCIEELKFAPDLHTGLKGKGVVFVNLCLASDLTKWVKLVAQTPIDGENYFLSDDATKLFMSTYHLNGYPSYILVNKSGKIVSTHAPRLSDTKTKATLISLLQISQN